MSKVRCAYFGLLMEHFSSNTLIYFVTLITMIFHVRNQFLHTT